MKKIILYIILMNTLAITGCKKYLDQEPDNRTAVTTPEQIAQLLTTAYPNANYMLFCESMSDNAEDKQGGGSGYDFIDKINRESYRYEVVETAPDNLDCPDFYWNGCYKAIAASNQALEIIDASPDKAQLGAHRGEALVARAYSHFMLVTLFAKVYDPSTAANDPGIPYVTKPETEIFAQYQRSTVAQVYEMIEKDLLEGLPLINDNIYGTATKFHFNKKAAAAFAARFYLFKKDYNSVVNYASQALGSLPASSIRPWNTILTDLQYAELQAEYTKSTLAGNLLLQETNSIWGRSFVSLRFGLGDQVANRVLITRNVSGGQYAYDLYGANPRVYNIPKFYEYFVRENLNANSGQPYNTIPLFTGEEALLNRAEAYFSLNNNGAAITDMNTFISKNIDEYSASSHNVSLSKINNYYGSSSATPPVLQAILDFKRAFFMHEGLRWLDILRLHIPVTHFTAEGEVIQLSADDNRRVLQLPATTRQAGLEQNQR